LRGAAIPSLRCSKADAAAQPGSGRGCCIARRGAIRRSRIACVFVVDVPR
jgi:hypothetical protein